MQTPTASNADPTQKSADFTAMPGAAATIIAQENTITLTLNIQNAAVCALKIMPKTVPTQQTQHCNAGNAARGMESPSEPHTRNKHHSNDGIPLENAQS